MNIGDRAEVLEMMRVFYTSPAVRTDGNERIFADDFTNCVNGSPYLEGYIFESENSVCGYAMLAKSFSTEYGKPCIWIEDLYIKESSRGKGIGRSFFEFIENEYTDVVFRLEAEKENNAAVNLYTKCGFEPMPYLEMIKL